jgi:hypothetical protein
MSDEELDRIRRRHQPTALGSTPVFFVSALDKPTTGPLMRAIERHLWEQGRVDEPPTMAPDARDAPVVGLDPPREDDGWADDDAADDSDRPAHG